jgi:hypothetical protein
MLPAAFTELADGCSWLCHPHTGKKDHVLVWYIVTLHVCTYCSSCRYCCFEDIHVQLVLLSLTVACCADRNGVCCKLTTTSVPQCITMSPSNWTCCLSSASWRLVTE